MPKKFGKANTNPSTGPSESWMKRIFGSPIQESTEKEWPELAKAWASAEVRMPKETAEVARVRPMDYVERHSPGLKDSYGALKPNKQLVLHKDYVTQDNMLRDALVHELTHAGQKPRGVIDSFKDAMLPWEKRPNEIEAMAAERNNPIRQAQADRKLRLLPGQMRDPRLPSKGMKNATK